MHYNNIRAGNNANPNWRMKMANITLQFKTVTNPDLSGFKFFVEEGKFFDAGDYAEAYDLNRSDIDAQDIHSVQDAAGRLNPGEWLEVTHETETAQATDFDAYWAKVNAGDVNLFGEENTPEEKAAQIEFAARLAIDPLAK